MPASSAPEHRERPRKARAISGRTYIISAAAITPAVFWLAAGQLMPDEAREHLVVAGLSAVVAVVTYAIGTAAKCCMAWIKQREQTKREQPQIEMFRIARRTDVIEAKARARRFFRVKSDKTSTMSAADSASSLKEIIEACRESTDGQISE